MTGVQTCALPIWVGPSQMLGRAGEEREGESEGDRERERGRERARETERGRVVYAKL